MKFFSDFMYYYIIILRSNTRDSENIQYIPVNYNFYQSNVVYFSALRIFCSHIYHKVTIYLLIDVLWENIYSNTCTTIIKALAFLRFTHQ